MVKETKNADRAFFKLNTEFKCPTIDLQVCLIH